MEYCEVKNPEELLEFMECINYGVYSDGKVYFDENMHNAVLNKWKLSSPNELLKNKVGHCFDTVELERDWFSKNNYKFKTYFSIFLFDYENNYSTHTFLIYEEDNKFKVFEYSDFYNRGIHEYNTLNEAIKAMSKRQIEYNNASSDDIKYLCVYEYNNVKYGLSFKKFIDFIINTGKKLKNII